MGERVSPLGNANRRQRPQKRSPRTIARAPEIEVVLPDTGGAPTSTRCKRGTRALPSSNACRADVEGISRKRPDEPRREQGLDTARDASRSGASEGGRAVPGCGVF